MSKNNNLAESPTQWQNISALVAKAGHITVGHIAHIDCAAVAADERSVYATLVRRAGESIDELLQRLDHAIGSALYEGVFTNEVEGGQFMLAAPKGRKRKSTPRD